MLQMPDCIAVFQDVPFVSSRDYCSGVALRMIKMYPVTKSEAKVVYKEPSFVIEDYFITVFIRRSPVEDNTASEYIP